MHVGWNVCPWLFRSWSIANARVDLASMVAFWDGRHRTPSPSIPCIDPRLTVLWPSPAHSPPASPSEESSIEGDLSAFDDCPEDSSHACASGTDTSVIVTLAN